MPLVSVIVNVRNGASTLRDALDSVFAQTFQDWELIVWDDCSTDASADVVREYSDARIRYIRSPELVSLGRARQRAIELSRGEWIAFLDQDDIWLPHKLTRQLSVAKSDTGLVYGRTVRFYLSGTERDYDQAHEFRLLPEGDIFSQLFTTGCFPAMSSAMFRRTAIDAVGGISQTINIIPDYWLYVAVARKFPVQAVQEIVCRYRMHAESMSQSHAIRMHEEALWLVEQWAPALESRASAIARRRHHTAIALEEMRSGRSFWRGLRRLRSVGSWAAVLGRPSQFIFHLLRRNLLRPYFRKFGDSSAPSS